MKPKMAGHMITASLIGIAFAGKVTLDISDKLRAGREAYLAWAGQHWDELSAINNPRVNFAVLFVLSLLGFLSYELVSHGIGILLGKASRHEAKEN